MESRSAAAASVAVAIFLAVMMAGSAEAGDHNGVFSPCDDATVRRRDGFTFGIAFSNIDSFYLNQNRTLQLSPCDSRLSLSSRGAQLVVFRPKVDEISLLTVNTTTTDSSINRAGHMVAFAGRKYAARSTPIFVGNSSYAITSFTLILEFHKGTLQNFHWKTDCSACSGSSSYVCLNQGCAIRASDCIGQNQNGKVDCSIGIQLAFSGTDKHEVALNSWYEVSNLQQYSLYGLYSNLRDSLTSQYNRWL
ncbi:uncharacterized protein LOC141831903 [Curcuma longa]|uniref:uncharacterized protein LOC141831903 n=1 Tax=Curcuma longa TaxID=136217 RepID=UPI003D9DF260